MAEISRVERAAMQGEPMPTGLTWREVTEYIALRALYWGFKNRVFSRDDASAMKKQLMAALDGAEGAYQFQRKCWDNAARRYKETERAISAYRLERTLEHADALAAALDGLEKGEMK